MNRISRTAQTAGAVVGSVSVLVLLAGPALANHRIGPSEGEDSGPGLATLETLALFVLLPALVLLVVAGLAWLPNLRGGTRYRPNRGWDAAPVWFGGPANPADALATAQVADDNRGGAHGSW